MEVFLNAIEPALRRLFQVGVLLLEGHVDVEELLRFFLDGFRCIQKGFASLAQITIT